MRLSFPGFPSGQKSVTQAERQFRKSPLCRVLAAVVFVSTLLFMALLPDGSYRIYANGKRDLFGDDGGMIGLSAK